MITIIENIHEYTSLKNDFNESIYYFNNGNEVNGWINKTNKKLRNYLLNFSEKQRFYYPISIKDSTVRVESRSIRGYDSKSDLNIGRHYKIEINLTLIYNSEKISKLDLGVPQEDYIYEEFPMHYNSMFHLYLPKKLSEYKTSIPIIDGAFSNFFKIQVEKTKFKDLYLVKSKEEVFRNKKQILKLEKGQYYITNTDSDTSDIIYIHY